MKKRIGIDELQPGMLIEKLDRSWLDTPFFRHKMTITSHQQIAQLKACGVRTLLVSFNAEEIENTPEVKPDIGANAARPAIADTASIPAIVPFEEELPVARQVYQVAKTIIQDAMNDTRLGRAINVDAVESSHIRHD